VLKCIRVTCGGNPGELIAGTASVILDAQLLLETDLSVKYILQTGLKKYRKRHENFICCRRKMNRKYDIKRWGKMASVMLILAAGFFAVDIGRYFFYPDMKYFKKHNPAKTAFMEYREMTWRQQGVKKKIRKIWVPLSQVSPYALKAVIIAEDHKFWTHEGFDFEAMQYALEKNIKQNKVRVGGSTISQQLAKNLFLTPKKNPVRKIKEAILTWRLEKHLSKRRILELYLNVAEWGDGIFGIEMAARHHFGVSASGLSPRQAAMLAVILPNPRRYRTDGSSRYVTRQAERIYRIMVRQGIVVEEYDEIMKESDNFSITIP
jgi:monofunctional biosynthetic peptidoglycan transglycosylase